MVIFKGLISFAENLLNRSKWLTHFIDKLEQRFNRIMIGDGKEVCSACSCDGSLKSHSDIARSSTSFFSTKADIPEPPKRPPTAYMIFCKQNRPYVVKDNPNLRGPDLIKILAERWSALTPQLKKPYEETARESTIVYGKLHKEFYENLTEEERDALQKSKVEKRETKKVQKLKKALKGSGMPRFPSNAYTIFVQTRSKEVGAIKSGPHFIKQAAEEWHILTEEDKKVFYEKAKVERQRYESEIAEWREKLAAEGHINLLKSYEAGKYRQRVTAPGTSSSSVTAKKKTSVTKKSVSKKMAKPETK